MTIRKGAATRPFSSFEWMIARRYLGATRSGKGVSLISIIAFTGIMLAVAVLIIEMSVMQGFRAKLLEQMLGLNGHIFVQLGDQPEKLDDMIAEITAVPGILSAAPLIQAPVYATTPLGEEAVLVRAMHREDLLRISAITSPENIIQGSFENFGVGKSGGNHIAIGSRLAGSLGVQAGSGVTLIT
ncbi:MAG: ABC transporter permease, partial [Marinicaulis sp.]|nr:ABC transporter permease [Marinicaulis sp.]